MSESTTGQEAWDLRSRFRRVLALDPEAPALEFDDHWFPWRYFNTVLQKLDSALERGGINRTVAIGVAARNRPAHAAAVIALLVGGRCAVTVNPFVSPEKLAQDLEKLHVAVLVADEDDWKLEAMKRWAQTTGALAIALGSDEEAPVRVLPGHKQLALEKFRSAGDDVAVEMLTSGTTGEPKRIPLRYLTLNTSLRDGVRSAVGGEQLQLKRSPALLYAPLVHAGGLYALLLSVYEARSVALLEKFTVEGWRAAMRRHRPRFASLVPTLIRMILDAKVPREDLSSLIAVRSGTAPLDAEAHRAFEETYGIPILINYGATEFAGAVTGWTLQEYQKYGKAKFGSVGRPRGDIELRVVDAQTAQQLAANQIGVLEIRARRLGNEPDWMRTTDLARIDEDGFLFIHGRSDDAIIRGGFKVLPEQVADVLRRHEAVSDAVVIAMPDSRLGQVPAAAIEVKPGHPRPDPSELEAFARKHLAAYQVPVRFLILDALPRTPSMKVSRPAVREMFEQA